MNDAASTQRLLGIIFDFDGTLADTISLCIDAFHTAIEHVGLPRHTDEQIFDLFGPSEEGILAQLAGVDWEDAHRVFLDAYEREHYRCTEPFSGIVPMLDLLRERGTKLAIVTGKGAGTASISVPRLGLDRYFPIVEAGKPEGPVKPAAIRSILRRWNLPPQQVAYVGDAPRDMQDARETGLRSIGAAWADSTRIDTLRAEAPDELFTSVEALTAWLNEHA